MKLKSIIGLILVLVLYLGYPLVIRLMMHYTLSSEYNQFTYTISRLLYWISAGMLFLYCIKVEKRPLLIWKDKRRSFWFYPLSVFILILVTFVVMIIFQTIYYTFFPIEKSLRLNSLINIFKEYKWLVVLTAITAGVIEELVMRGYVQTRMEELFKNKIAAIILSSILFGFLHIGFGTISNMIGPTVIGLIFATYYRWFKNIKVLIITHVIWDLVIVGIQVLYEPI